MANGDNQYYPFVQSAVNAARGVEPPPIATEQSLHVLRAIFAADRAVDTGSTQKSSCCEVSGRSGPAAGRRPR